MQTMAQGVVAAFQRQSRLARWVSWPGAIVLAAACINAITARDARAQAPAAAADWDRIVAAAKKEGKVVLYHVLVPPVMVRVKAEFEKLYPGIVIEETRMPGAVIVSKFDQERAQAADGADGTVSSELLWLEARAKEGSLKAPVGPAKTYPPAYMLGGVAPVVALEPLIMAVNTSLIKSEVTKYQDLLRPEFKGKIGASEPFSTLVVAWYNWIEKTQGPDFLSRLAAQAPRFYTGAVPTTQAAASGEVAISLYSVASVVQPLVAQGAPLKIIVPEPNLATSYVVTAFSWAKRPNAALVFMDYLMSKQGQTTWHGKGESASPLPGVVGSLNPATINVFDPRPFPPNAAQAYREKWTVQFKRP